MYISLFSSMMRHFTTTDCLSREILGQFYLYQQYVLFLPMHRMYSRRATDFDPARLLHRFSVYAPPFPGRSLIIREVFTRFKWRIFDC
jgi:hypothetical protein